MKRGQTLIEKIAQRCSVNESSLNLTKSVYSGDFVAIRPAYCMTHDNTAAVLTKFKSYQTDQIKSPRQIVFTLDHNIQDKTEKVFF